MARGNDSGWMLLTLGVALGAMYLMTRKMTPIGSVQNPDGSISDDGSAALFAQRASQPSSNSSQAAPLDVVLDTYTDRIAQAIGNALRLNNVATATPVQSTGGLRVITQEQVAQMRLLPNTPSSALPVTQQSGASWMR